MPVRVRVAVPILILAVTFALGGVLGVRSAAKEGPAPFVVHEWGTFTSMQGSDGLGLEGLQHEEERLPDFVYSRTQVRECPLREYGYKGLEVPVEHVTEKLETPVLYFHSDVPRKVRVRVDFVRGLITQWYPVSNLIGPPERAEEDGPLDIAEVERSFLEWDIDVLPRSGGRPAGIPHVEPDEPWAFARDVDAAYVRTLPRAGEDRMGPVEAEHYLFYRGLGTFTLPLAVEAAQRDRGVVRNGGEHAALSTYVLEADARGRVRFARLGTLPPGGERAFDLSTATWHADADLLREMYVKELHARGLYEDEARAMVRTWARQWFTTEGTRVMYVVPRKVTDALLPLSIDPQPDRLVRVLVGRLEYVTPEVQAEVETALRDRVADDAAKAGLAQARLLRLGRFLEPHVRNALHRTEDETVRASGQALLAALAQEAPQRR
jgi:hypothetical protein